ncbi:YbdK family carboxylate-amine ligase [Thermosulfurimonas marina]|uniref:Putative glutamate--cysteine ligase 2 n=1 Tax=Thermosulfurimonas marina TaxID=2047767 RepID=A0A6H1WQS2_9BACT|nr:YbdK family carboxylate-amine ligase [Thermosulfurimonas marina]QJA05565.1 YbdK family carboxylate-amine ligase [Thermosulfurimonas marina]
MIAFRESPALTLGMEIEFQVLRAEDLSLAPGGPLLLAEARKVPELAEWVRPEFIRSMLEIVTPVCQGVAEAEAWLRENLSRLFKMAEVRGYRLLAASLHPFSRAAEQRVWEDPRYESLREELQLVGRRFISQGLHIHLGMPSAEEALRAYRWFRLYTPVFLALTTSSPFYEGEFTGFYSYRSKLFEALPLAGYPRDFPSYADFSALVEELLGLGIINHPRDLWWDVRPHPLFGTLELRVCDLPSRFSEILAVAALARALARTVLSEKAEPPEVPMEILRYNKWQAARHGLEGFFVDPLTRRKNTFREFFREFLFRCAGALAETGERPYVLALERVVEEGTSAHRQINLYAETQDFRRVIESLLEGFWS